MARRTNRLNVDRLEARDLMSGNIIATIANNNLFLNEAVGQSGQSNFVQVRQLSNGKIRVEGQINEHGDRTLVNGAQFRDFTLPTSGGLIATFGAGNDLLQVFNVTRFNTVNVDLGRRLAVDTDVVNISGGTTTKGEVRIATGDGNDSVFIQDVQVGDGIGVAAEDLIIDTGTGDDVANIAGGVNIRGSARIATGDGNDIALVRESQIGDGLGVGAENLFIDSGAGADLVQVGQVGGFVEVQGTLSVTTFASIEADADTVKVLQTFVGRSLLMSTGAGDDTIDLGSVSVGADIVMVAGEGNDSAKFREVSAGDQFFINMATGNDTLDMTFLSANFLSVDGGLGFDRLTTQLPGPTGSSIFTGWEVINGLTIPLTGGLGVSPPGGGFAP